MTQVRVENEQGLAALSFLPEVGRFIDARPSSEAEASEPEPYEWRAACGGHFANLPPTPPPSGFAVPLRIPPKREATPTRKAPKLGAGVHAGDRYGRLVAIDDAGVVTQYGMRRSVWRWACDCGRVVTHRPDAVKRGGVQSCGCMPPGRKVVA
jgi:hypothetical protein